MTESNFKLASRTTIAILALVVIGLVLIVVSLWLTEGFWSQLCSQLSTALLVGGIWTGVYEWFMRKDFINVNREQAKEILDRIKLAQGEESIGLYEVYDDSNDFNYSSLLLQSRQLTILLNDGRTWISTHSEDIKKRLRDREKSTTFLVLHPEAKMLEVMAIKVDSTPANLRAKIAESVKMLRNLSDSDSNVEILGHHLFNPQSMFIGDSIAVVTPYYAARGRRTVPLFRFGDSGDHSYYRKLMEDLHDLKNDAVDISDYERE
ncbi:hypothetical protein QO259_12675 [Salinicola sp. JS01]|uniref:hypothetical protein n=1 Tax=Salinicola sp. JS01 TaxID=3050071 RepID=UPI00255BF655|nr:hypothetical protein [Salinicola sp. JS01]WIX31668.1 hypothetical protein QO259_12675 [Salinicola sp. JS01]